MQLLGEGLAGVAELGQGVGQCLDELWLPALESMQPADDLSSSLSDWMAGLEPHPSKHASTHPGACLEKHSPVQQQSGSACVTIGGSNSSGTHGSSCSAAWGPAPLAAPCHLPGFQPQPQQQPCCPPQPGAFTSCYPAAASSPYGSSCHSGMTGRAPSGFYWPGSDGSDNSSYSPATAGSFHAAAPPTTAYYGCEGMAGPEAAPAVGQFPCHPSVFGSLPAAAQGMGLPSALAAAAPAAAFAGFCSCCPPAAGWPHAGAVGMSRPHLILPPQQDCGYGPGACLLPAYQPHLGSYSQPQSRDSYYTASMQAAGLGGELSSSRVRRSSSFGGTPAAMQASPSPSGPLAHCTLPSVPPPATAAAAAAADTSSGSLSAASGDAAAPGMAAGAASKPPARLGTRRQAAAAAAAAASAARPVKQPAAAAASASAHRVQQGWVSKPPRSSTAGSVTKPEGLSQAVKRRIKEEQEQSDMQASSDKIKGLTETRERLSTALQQLQASRDKAAAALAKLKGAYETMAADNAKLRSNNAELQGLIDGVKQQLFLQGVAVPTPKQV